MFQISGTLYGKSIFYLVSVFGLSVNVKFLEGIKHFSFPRKVNYVRCVVHWAESVAFVNDMLGKHRPVVCVFKIVIMFAEPYMERTAGLTCVFLVASETLKLVNSIFLIFIGLWVFCGFGSFSTLFLVM